MTWIVKINLVGGEWYCCVVITNSAEEAKEQAYEYFLNDEFEVDSVTVEVFEQSVHGDTVDYEILN